MILRVCAARNMRADASAKLDGKTNKKKTHKKNEKKNTLHITFFFFEDSTPYHFVRAPFAVIIPPSSGMCAGQKKKKANEDTPITPNREARRTVSSKYDPHFFFPRTRLNQRFAFLFFYSALLILFFPS